nr:hypothetical protein [Tanacetum cinerariifolium]
MWSVTTGTREDILLGSAELQEIKTTSTRKVQEGGNPQMDLQDQWLIDSGCSRHMTGNMSYLTDYEEIDEGYFAFGWNPKGGKITGKGKARKVLKVNAARHNLLMLDEAVYKELGDKLDRMKLDEFMALRTNLQNGVLDLEKTKTTQQNEIATQQQEIASEKEDEDITLVSVQDDDDKEMFDVDNLVSDEVFVAGQHENVVEEVVNADQVSTAAVKPT